MAIYEIDNKPSEIYFGNEIVKRTLQNAKNLLMCEMGSVPYDRYRGFDTGFQHKPLEEIKQRILQELDRVMLWEPDVEVVSAEVSRREDGSLYIRAKIEINFED